MSVPVELPELGESVVEGIVARWLVKEGDRVEVDQPLVEVTTDKVDAEIPSPVSGIVESIFFSEGETVPIGAILVNLREEDGPVKAEETRQFEPSVTGSVRATPVASLLAEKEGVDIRELSGSGVGGRVTKEDVRASLQNGKVRQEKRILVRCWQATVRSFERQPLQRARSRGRRMRL